MVNCYAGYTESERRGTSPLPPFKGGKERKRRGDVIPSKGECGAVSHQQTACGMPCRGEPQCSPFFCVVSAISEREFRKWRKSTQITSFVIPNTVRNLAGEREEILRFALNDKLMVNGQWLIVMPGTRNPNAEGAEC